MNNQAAHVNVCPFCEHATPGAESRREANVRLANHIQSYHRDRLVAWREYQRVLSGGGAVESARAAYNQTLHRLAGGPGSYPRAGRVST